VLAYALTGATRAVLGERWIGGVRLARRPVVL
jgi:hypothetical protein